MKLTNIEINKCLTYLNNKTKRRGIRSLLTFNKPMYKLLQKVLNGLLSTETQMVTEDEYSRINTILTPMLVTSNTRSKILKKGTMKAIILKYLNEERIISLKHIDDSIMKRVLDDLGIRYHTGSNTAYIFADIRSEFKSTLEPIIAEYIIYWPRKYSRKEFKELKEKYINKNFVINKRSINK